VYQADSLRIPVAHPRAGWRVAGFAPLALRVLAPPVNLDSHQVSNINNVSLVVQKFHGINGAVPYGRGWERTYKGGAEYVLHTLSVYDAVSL